MLKHGDRGVVRRVAVGGAVTIRGLNSLRIGDCISARISSGVRGVGHVVRTVHAVTRAHRNVLNVAKVQVRLGNLVLRGNGSTRAGKKARDRVAASNHSIRISNLYVADGRVSCVRNDNIICYKISKTTSRIRLALNYADRGGLLKHGDRGVVRRVAVGGTVTIRGLNSLRIGDRISARISSGVRGVGHVICTVHAVTRAHRNVLNVAKVQVRLGNLVLRGNGSTRAGKKARDRVAASNHSIRISNLYVADGRVSCVRNDNIICYKISKTTSRIRLALNYADRGGLTD